MPQIVIDQERCNHCGACVALCNSGNVYAQENDTVQVTNIENCWSCGHCVAVCPTDAIGHSQFLIAWSAILYTLSKIVRNCEGVWGRRTTAGWKLAWWWDTLNTNSDGPFHGGERRLSGIRLRTRLGSDTLSSVIYILKLRRNRFIRPRIKTDWTL